MKYIIIGLAGLVVPLLVSGNAEAWSHANARGGYSYGAGDSFHHENAYGGGETHVAGYGTTAHTAYGGTAYHQEGSGETHMTNAYGESATHYQGYGTAYSGAYHGDAYYGGAYVGYHPPAAVNYYGAGCYDCGGWNTAGAAAAGLVVGAAVATSVASANTAAATSNAYAAGVAAGATYAMGAVYATLPAGCQPGSVNNQNYYVCGSTWMQPAFGANGVYYKVVPVP
jgi:hypothetical protein